LFKGIEQALTIQKHHAILCNGYHRFQAELDAIHTMQGKIDGAIINPTSVNVHNPAYVRYFSELARSKEFPFLLVDIMIPGVNAHYVGFDDFKAFVDMARLLAVSKIRFKQVLYFGAMESIIGAERISGFRAGLKEHNIPEELVKIINVPLPVSDISLSIDDLRGQGPVLVVAASPLILPKLLSFCAAHNLKIPENVVIAAVLEENFRDYIHAPILGWVKPSLKLGMLSVGIIQALIAGKPVERITRLALEKFIPGELKNLL
jgi:DNA-binding LacI/PurR family transcriptional regulator